MHNQKTLWELLQIGSITVPAVQRDYAQGRKSQDARRTDFLATLFNALSSDPEKGSASGIHLDFVYGRTRKVYDELDFIPVDGQQRLTTLMLLHWYAAKRDETSSSAQQALRKFSYATRQSSRTFCNCLHSKDIPLPPSAGDDALAQTIKNSNWYRSAWDYDPTIQAMIIMLQAIHDRFHAEKGLWRKLTEDRLITFQLFDLGEKEFQLTDELYIKMNARGKILRPFENFKADFIDFLEKAGHYQGKTISHPAYGTLPYADYFSFRLEKEWMDFFWSFRPLFKDSLDLDTDALLFNYISFIASYCFFKNNKNAAAESFRSGDLVLYKKIFADENNLLFLFSSIDLLCELSSTSGEPSPSNLDRFFEEIFLNEEPDKNEDGKINLNMKGQEYTPNLVVMCLTGKSQIRENILLYCLLAYMMKFNIRESNRQLRDFLRVIRNLLRNVRSRHEVGFASDVRINDFGGYWILFEQLLIDADVNKALVRSELIASHSNISDRALQDEKGKANIFQYDTTGVRFVLEEFDVFEGFIQQVAAEDNFLLLPDFCVGIREIWGRHASPDLEALTIRALIACGFNGIDIKSCALGEMQMWFFGGGGSGGWERILAGISADNELEKDAGKIVQELLKKYSRNHGSALERLQSIIDSWLTQNPLDRSWRYYFIKYESFTSLKYKYYAWKSRDDPFTVQILGSIKWSPLMAKHINAAVLAVCRERPQYCDEEKSYRPYIHNQHLVTNSTIIMRSESDGWYIYDTNGPIPSSLIHKYNLQTADDGAYLLVENISSNNDRITVAVEFLDDIFA